MTLKSKDRAAQIIQTALADGELEREALFALTKAQGIGSKATYDALTDLGLKSQPAAFGKGWVYRLAAAAVPAGPFPQVSIGGQLPAPPPAEQSVESTPTPARPSEPAPTPSETTARYDLRIVTISSSNARQLMLAMGKCRMRWVSGGTFDVLDLDEARCGEIESIAKVRHATTVRSPHRATK